MGLGHGHFEVLVVERLLEFTGCGVCRDADEFEILRAGFAHRVFLRLNERRSVLIVNPKVHVACGCGGQVDGHILRLSAFYACGEFRVSIVGLLG